MKKYSVLVGVLGMGFGLLLLFVFAGQYYQGAEVSYRGAMIGVVDIVVSACLIWQARTAVSRRGYDT